MKKLLALALVVFGLAACQTEPEGFDVTVNGEVPVTVTVDLSDAVGTRANSAEGAIDNKVVTSNDYTLRYALQVFNENGTASKDIKYKYTDATSVAFDLRLVPNRNYKFVVWADIVDENQNPTDGDECTPLHYAIVDDLRNITLVPGSWKAMDETRDAYTGVYNANNFKATDNITIKLKRPFAKLRVVTTDIAELFDGVVPDNAVATYTTKHRRSFDAFTQKAGEATLQGVQHTFNISGYNEVDDAVATNKTLFVDYFFAADQDDVVNFTLDVKEANGTTIKENTFNTPIPVKRNFLTTIKGNVLTEGNKINVDIDDNFGENQENQENWGTISSQTELNAAVAAGGLYKVINLITLTNSGAGTTAVRFAATPTAVETVIDLNGYTITAKNTDDDKALITVAAGNTLTFTGEGNVILTSDSTGDLIDNKGTVNIDGGTFENNSTNSDTKLIENSNDAVVNVTGGSIDLDEEVDGGATTDYLAQLAEAFANGGVYELPTDLTLSEPLTLAAGKTLTLNLNGKTIKQSQAQTGAYSMITNNGTLTIKGNGTIDYADTADLTADINYVSNAIQNNGVLTIEDATIINSSTDSVADYGFPHCIDNSGTLTINSGTLTNKTKYSSIRIWCTTDDDTNVTINGGTFNGCIDFHNVSANANKGTLTINNGVFNAEKNAVRLVGFGVDVDELNGYIKGGVFNGNITLRNYTSGEFNSQVFFISGGTFSNDPSAFVAESYEAVEQNGVWVVTPSYSVEGDVYTIYTANGLKWLAQEVNKYSNYEYPFKDKTVKLNNDIDLGGIEWTPIGDYRFSANRFCGTFDGQGYTISNFKITKKTDKDDANKSSYGFFGNMEGTVKNLTISNATVSSYAYCGALIGRVNNGTVENCHVINSNVSCSYWQAGGMIGQANDAVTVKDCTISNSTVTGASAIGGLIGPFSVTDKGSNGEPAIVQNCKVINCEIIQDGSFGESYDKYFGSMFAYLDAEDGSIIEIENCVAEDTTVKGEEGELAYSITGKTIYINGVRYVSTSEHLQDAFDDGDTNIKFHSDITGDVEITQKSGVNVVIDGANKKFAGVMTTYGKGYNNTRTETLTIKNINFEAKAGASSCIVSPDRSKHNAYSYSHNVTVENCTFTDLDGTVNCAAVRHEDGGDWNWVIRGCTVDSTMHSILQVNNVEGKLTIDDCEVYSKNGANLNSCTNVEMTECNFDVKGYALRFGVNSGGNLGTAKTYLVKDSTLKSACDDGDAVIMFRASAVDANLTLTNTSLVGTTEISGNTEATTIVRN